MPTRDETSRLFDELEAQLAAAMEHARFDVYQLTSAPAAAVATMFHAPNRPNRLFAMTARPTLDHRYLDPIVGCLDEILDPYVQPDGRRLGNGLGLLMGGRPVLPVAEFALIVVRACAALGTKQALHLLRGWVEGAPIRYFQRLAIIGLSSDQPTIQLTDTIAIDKLPQSEQELGNAFPDMVGIAPGSISLLGRSVLSIGMETRPAFYRPDETGFPERQTSLADRRLPPFSLSELREALSLACDSPIDYDGSWQDYGDIQAFSSGAVSGKVITPTAFSHGQATVGQAEWSHAVRILRQRGQPSKGRPQLDLAIQRWWSSKGAQDRAHQLIDLRIALECLYQPENSGELSFRVALRGAWHLGTTYEERKEHWRALRQAYSLASTAVHTGDVKEESKTFDVLNRGQDLCRLGILKRLEEGDEPDWNDLILGKPDDGA